MAIFAALSLLAMAADPHGPIHAVQQNLQPFTATELALVPDAPGDGAAGCPLCEIASGKRGSLHETHAGVVHVGVAPERCPEAPACAAPAAPERTGSGPRAPPHLS